MNDMAIGYILATDAAVREARSALPNAPTLADRVRAHGRTRLALAGWLHGVADRMTPTPVASRATCETAS
ncbi:MAG: hypothetical protein QOG69_3090 [Actinomycetota bacterium]|jgi:hypothetical protein|nr:hypothetical protein [Actinomycetota bacterium]